MLILITNEMYVDNKWKVIENKWNVINNKWNVILITNEM